ncbi:MAG: amidoligase family protein [Clostridiales bacterium]|nr:amidoligase family protein [Clostridiales bacterium]
MKKNFNKTGVIFTDGYDEDNSLYTCSECGKSFEEDDLIFFDSLPYCKECFEEYTTVCDCCGERVHIDFTESDSENTVCCYCAEQYYYRCAECDCLVSSDKLYVDEDGNYLCCDCWERLEGNTSIHKYLYKPEPIFHKENKEKGNLRFFGVEIETDRRSSVSNETAEETAKILLAEANNSGAEDKFYLKIDQSLKYGFELVSHPMTLAYHLNSMPWKTIMTSLLEKGYISNSSETCGLHIHVNKSSLGDTEEEQNEVISNILLFVENNWDKILKFSRRTEIQMNRWAARYGIKEHGRLKEIAKDKNSENRYTCVNLQNRDTVEFRMFKGTLNYTVFAAALQLVNAICDIAKTSSAEETEAVSWTEFTRRINRNENKELFSYLSERKLLS